MADVRENPWHRGLQGAQRELVFGGLGGGPLGLQAVEQQPCEAGKYHGAADDPPLEVRARLAGEGDAGGHGRRSSTRRNVMAQTQGFAVHDSGPLIDSQRRWKSMTPAFR